MGSDSEWAYTKGAKITKKDIRPGFAFFAIFV